ncbi:MAG: hypothetical protein J6X03_00750 [Bacilli bacterium]|nr:hypothetical protein [Bacilli bacterium]
MENSRILSNINSLIMMLRSKGVQTLSATKFLLFINDKYGLALDQEGLENLLADNKSVVSFDGDRISIGEPENDEEEEASDNVHDMAVDAAADNMSMESVDMSDVLAIFENLKVGQEIDSKNVNLKESDDNYFFNNGVKKAKGFYIITELKPSTTLEESKVRCKVKGDVLFTDLPVTSIKF